MAILVFRNKNINTMIITILKYLKRMLVYSIKNFEKIGPLALIVLISIKFRNVISSFFISSRTIREVFIALNRLPAYRALKYVLRVLSISSLLLNLIILMVFTDFDIFKWIPSVPAVSQTMLFFYEASPNSTQDYISWIAIKIKTFILWLWYSLIGIIKRIIKAVIGELDKYPTYNPDWIDPDKDKYGDIHNPEYRNWLANKLDEYKYYIISSFLFIILFGIIFLYWDSIFGCWRSRQDDPDPNISSDLPVYNPDAPVDRPKSFPSVSSGSSNSLKEFFRKSIPEKLKQYKNKVKNFFIAKAPPKLENIPKGIYSENGKDMYNGLPLPRVEVLPDGTEYYFSKDKDGFLEVMSDKFNGMGNVDIVNPFSNKAVFSHDISVNERISFINKARSNAIYIAPEDSYARNPILEYVNTDFSRPSFSSTSAASSSNLPGDNDGYEDIPLGPQEFTDTLIDRLKKGKNRDTGIIPENINPETSAFNSGDKTPTQDKIFNPFD